MRIDEIAKGEVIEIEAKCDGKMVNFRSGVIDTINHSILVNTIKVDDQSIGFSENCMINIIYVHDGKVNLWENAFIRLVRYNNEVYHIIEAEGEGKPYNRRGSYRIYIGEDMPLFVYSDQGPIAITALIKDISETGVAFIAKEEFEVNSMIRLKLYDGSYWINLTGVILRKDYRETLGSFLYGCKLSGKNIRLGKYIVKRQNELLQKKFSPSAEPLTPLAMNKKEKTKDSVATKR